VNFPGGVTATATVLGPHRATAIVPATATSGTLSVTTGGIDTASVPFRTTPFVPKLANFRTQFEQTDAARPAPVVATARAGASAAVAGNWLYVIGGKSGTTYLSNVERAMINGDGTLGAFGPAASTLMTGRAGAATAVIGGYVYVIGGTGTGGPINNVERAAIEADGTLDAFATVSGVTLTTARSDAACAIVGDEILVIGGNGASGKLASIERAVVDPDGTLEAFTTDAQTLPTPRAGAAAIATAGSLYVIGGEASSGVKTIVESAAIAPDGTLGTFAATTGVGLASARAYFTAAVLGSTVYVAGGTGAGGTDIATIESATVAPDGTLGSFSLVSGVQTMVARHGAAVAFARDRVFMIGGSTQTGELASIESASVDNDGALATFNTLPTVPLSGPRIEGTSVMIGDRLYLIGGADVMLLTPRNDVDSATVLPDGSLGAFSLVSGVTLTSTRLSSSIAVIGSYVYVIGGTDTSSSNNGLTTVERAPINADGTLGTFAAYTASHLVIGRSGAPVAVVGNSLYIFGGAGNGFAALSSIEKAPIDASGNLGTFTSITNRLAFNHAAASVAVLGNYLYVLGGLDGAQSTSVFERGSTLNGNLGTIDYQLDSNANQMYMSVPRTLHTSAVVGDHLYLIAGANNVGMPSDPGLRNVDHSAVLSDGSLGGFSLLSTSTLSDGPFYHQGARAGSYVYVLGGASHTSTTTATEVKQALLP
jgi:N-acetylneuraminic acid mutarotase